MVTKLNTLKINWLFIVIVTLIPFIVFKPNASTYYSDFNTNGYINSTDAQKVALAKTNVQRVKKHYTYLDRYIETLNATNYEKRLLKWLVYCESTGNEHAKNKRSAASGLLQFMPSTFRANCSGDIWSGEDQINCALSMIRNGQKGQWVCTNRGGF